MTTAVFTARAPESRIPTLSCAKTVARSPFRKVIPMLNQYAAKERLEEIHTEVKAKTADFEAGRIKDVRVLLEIPRQSRSRS